MTADEKKKKAAGSLLLLRLSLLFASVSVAAVRVGGKDLFLYDTPHTVNMCSDKWDKHEVVVWRQER